MESRDQTLKLKKLVKELDAIRGRHTELVSVYIPAGYNIVEVVNQLKAEQGTASNIKSKSTRKNVLTALEKIIQHLRVVGQTPANGLIVFSGNISPVEGREQIELWSIEPPVKMATKMYWCDQSFVLDPLKEMAREREVYGLIVMDAKDAAIGLLVGKTIQTLKEMDSMVMSKTVKGGMCLSPDTSITIKDGTTIPINKLERNKKVLSYDFKKSSFVTDVCDEIMKRNVKEALRISTRNSEVITSLEHLFFTKIGKRIKEKFAEDLKIGDSLFMMSNERCITEKIRNKTLIKINKTFYDISVPNHENFLANGIVVHNSQHRYDRIREDAINEFLTKVGETASKFFLEQKELKGVIVGGPGPIKERIATGDYLNYQIKNKILGVKDVSYTGEYGLNELVQRSEDLLMEAAVVHERRLLNKFFTALQKEGLVTYGAVEVRKALEAGAVDTLLISEDFDWRRVKLACQCGYESELDMPAEKLGEIKSDKLKVKCDKCRGVMQIAGEKDMTELLIAEAEKLGTAVEFVSTGTTEGQQFKELGGIGALLRYKV